jgi:hypothetical protein
MKKTFLSCQLTLLLMFCFQERIIASNCFPRSITLPCERYTGADVIFIGHKISGRKIITYPGDTKEGRSPHFDEIVTFEITEAFKGVSSKTIVIEVSDPFTYRPRVDENEEWLIYGYRNSDNKFSTTVGCESASILISESTEAQKDLNFLREALSGEIANWVGGIVTASYSDPVLNNESQYANGFSRPVPDALIRITKDEKPIETRTDFTGRYFIKNLTSGTYVVEVVPPAGYSVPAQQQYQPDPIRRTILVSGAGCGYFYFHLNGSNEIARQIIAQEERLNRKTPWLRYSLFSVIGLTVTGMLVFLLSRFKSSETS